MTRGPTSSQRAAIVELARRGHPPAEIQQQIAGVTRGQIYAVLKDARARGLALARFTSAGPRRPCGTVVARATPATRKALTEVAKARGLAVRDFAGRLLDTIVADDLLGAILDGD